MALKALGLSCILLISATPALAHHSFVMYDQTRQLTLEGIVKEFKWTNPHSWLEIAIVNAQGQEEVWPFEMSTPRSMAQVGMNPASILPGQEVTVTYNPMRDGSVGGNYLSVQMPDGTVFERSSAGGATPSETDRNLGFDGPLPELPQR